jgi:bacteriocin biosynthesis cyclodehydratase domain-containing protein
VRPILRPGTHLLRRGPGQLQVGLDPAAALVLADSPAVRSALRLLAPPADLVGATPDRPAAGEPVGGAGAGDPDDGDAVLDLLAGHRQLVDSRDLLPLLTGSIAPPTVAALVRQTGDHAAETVAARRRWRTETRSFGHPSGSGLRGAFESLTSAAGLGSPGPSPDAPVDCGVLLGVGEPDRELVDAWTRGGTPHLLVRLTEGRAVIGPFVEPGATACLRCLDAHHQDADPAWPLLVRQYAAASARDRSDGAPEPVDPLLAALAVAWAARDLASYADGARPSTWSSTITLHPRLARLETRRWLRHPGCGCSWE